MRVASFKQIKEAVDACDLEELVDVVAESFLAYSDGEVVVGESLCFFFLQFWYICPRVPCIQLTSPT